MKNNELEYQAIEISRILDSGIEILPNSLIHLKLKEALTFCEVIKSLPSKEEILSEPIENALYATGRFTTDQCTELANGIIMYLDDYNIDIGI